MENCDLTAVHTLSNEMITGINVLCPRVMFRVLRKSFRAFVVDVEGKACLGS
jgi:hypothetical protein